MKKLEKNQLNAVKGGVGKRDHSPGNIRSTKVTKP